MRYLIFDLLRTIVSIKANVQHSGACMSRDGTGTYGVTNQYGEVFKGTGSETWPGLIVTDAAVIPTALGANPFATITALAERSVEHQAQKLDLTVSKRKNGLSRFPV